MLKDKLLFQEMINKMTNLIIYKNLKEDIVLKHFFEYLKKSEVEEDSSMKYHYYDFIAALIEKNEELGFSGDIFKKYIVYLILSDENIFSIMCEKKLGLLDTSIYNFALEDIKNLFSLMSFPFEKILLDNGYSKVIKNYIPVVPTMEESIDKKILKSKSVEEALNSIILFYRDKGCGKFSMFKMFKYDCDLGVKGIKNYDKVTFEDIIGYDYQKAELINNTKAFLLDKPANNVLLIGSRGTGKSSSVKALANSFYDVGLRLIEVSKDDIDKIPLLYREISKRGMKFIIYIDDLSYEETETKYKYLKTILEGSSEQRPKNVLFYVTSNRRHIVSEKFSDKKSIYEDDDLHGTDTINEKFALSDRFGLTITFGKATHEEYFDIVIGLAKRNEINITTENLKKLAAEWELNQNVRSGRTARQFIDNLMGSQDLNL